MSAMLGHIASSVDYECAGILPDRWRDAMRDSATMDYVTWRGAYCRQPRGMTLAYFDTSARACYESGPLTWWLVCRTN